jgi:hypothetical protein
MLCREARQVYISQYNPNYLISVHLTYFLDILHINALDIPISLYLHFTHQAYPPRLTCNYALLRPS